MRIFVPFFLGTCNEVTQGIIILCEYSGAAVLWVWFEFCWRVPAYDFCILRNTPYGRAARCFSHFLLRAPPIRAYINTPATPRITLPRGVSPERETWRNSRRPSPPTRLPSLYLLPCTLWVYRIFRRFLQKGSPCHGPASAKEFCLSRSYFQVLGLLTT